MQLTKENLKRLNPEASSPISSTWSESEGDTEIVVSEGSTRIIATGDVFTREVLNGNNHFIDDGTGREVGEDLIRDARRVVEGGRHSAMRKETQKYRGEIRTATNLTFLVKLWESLLGQTRRVEKKERRQMRMNHARVH